MIKSPIMSIVGMSSWVITAIASINVGLGKIGYGFMFPMWMDYIIGLAGAVSLGLIVMTLSCGENGCFSFNSKCSDSSRKCSCGNPSCNGCNKKSHQQSGSSNQQKKCPCGKVMGNCSCGK